MGPSERIPEGALRYRKAGWIWTGLTAVALALLFTANRGCEKKGRDPAAEIRREEEGKKQLDAHHTDLAHAMEKAIETEDLHEIFLCASTAQRYEIALLRIVDLGQKQWHPNEAEIENIRASIVRMHLTNATLRQYANQYKTLTDGGLDAIKKISQEQQRKKLQEEWLPQEPQGRLPRAGNALPAA